MKVLTEKEVAELCKTEEGFAKLITIANAVVAFRQSDMPVTVNQIRTGFKFPNFDERGDKKPGDADVHKPEDKE